MIKRIVFIGFIALMFSGCVSKKVFEELQSRYNTLQENNATLIAEKESLLEVKKQLEEELAALKAANQILSEKEIALNQKTISLQNKLQKLEKSYENLSNKSSEELKGQAAANKKLITQLEEKELALEKEKQRLEKLQRELSKRSEEINELQQLINEKEKQMQGLRKTISDALHSFEGRGLTVEHKNGKIYVSMENKLLFSSGSWAVGAEGKNAIVKLAEVLSDNNDIQVLIEGHTDDVPFKSSTLEDNWDLSVKRATAIVRILEQNKVNPTQITAAGRSEFVPISENTNEEGKAKNRRIEIILAPNLDEISNLIKE